MPSPETRSPPFPPLTALEAVLGDANAAASGSVRALNKCDGKTDQISLKRRTATAAAAPGRVSAALLA
jgi:hypothetical protein